MIDYVNYQQVERDNPKNKNYLETTLKAKLSFKDEVAQKEVSAIKDRLKWKKGGDSLRNYLEGKENLSYTGLGDIPNRNTHFRRSEDDVGFKLKENLRRLGLEIKITSNKNVLRKDMFDLEALNNFILTGEYV